MNGLKIKQIENIVEKKIYEVLGRFSKDPDFGLELRPEFEKKLRKSIASARAGKLKDFKDVIADINKKRSNR